MHFQEWKKAYPYWSVRQSLSQTVRARFACFYHAHVGHDRPTSSPSIPIPPRLTHTNTQGRPPRRQPRGRVRRRRRDPCRLRARPLPPPPPRPILSQVMHHTYYIPHDDGLSSLCLLSFQCPQQHLTRSPHPPSHHTNNLINKQRPRPRLLLVLPLLPPSGPARPRLPLPTLHPQPAQPARGPARLHPKSLPPSSFLLALLGRGPAGGRGGGFDRRRASRSACGGGGGGRGGEGEGGRRRR